MQTEQQKDGMAEMQVSAFEVTNPGSDSSPPDVIEVRATGPQPDGTSDEIVGFEPLPDQDCVQGDNENAVGVEIESNTVAEDTLGSETTLVQQEPASPMNNNPVI